VICCGEYLLEGRHGLGQRRNIFTDRRQDVTGNVKRPAFVFDLFVGDNSGPVLDDPPDFIMFSA